LRGANEEQALRLRIQVAQKEALAEQMWKERMMTIVEAGLFKKTYEKYIEVGWTFCFLRCWMNSWIPRFCFLPFLF